MHFKITNICSWEEDRHMELGDACHMSEGDVMRKKLEEYEQKIENGEWPGLPFVCEASNEDEAIDKYNEAQCKYDYYLANEAEFEDRHEFESIKLRQLLGQADDNTLFRISNGDDGKILNVLNADFSDDHDEICALVDPLLDRVVSEFSVGMSEDPANEPGDTNAMPTIWVRLVPEKK